MSQIRVTAKVTANQCDRRECGHVWLSSKGVPKRCAKCKSPYWDKPTARTRHRRKPKTKK